VKATIDNIVFECPDGSWAGGRWEGGPRVLAEFYGGLLGMRIVREDWLVIARDPRSEPRLAFDAAPPEYRAPRWPDPAFPQQVHLDVAMADLDAGEALAVELGATPLQDRGTFRSYADPVGHPFCLYPKEGAADGQGRIERVVFDCSSPRALAAFWAELLDMPRRVEDTPERVLIAGDDPDALTLGFQHAPGLDPPRWPDPSRPQQIHLDLYVEEGGGAALEEAERLGAMRLPAMGGSCPVFADPSSHPFCLCSLGQ
jgi:hypothetical protein